MTKKHYFVLKFLYILQYKLKTSLQNGNINNKDIKEAL